MSKGKTAVRHYVGALSLMRLSPKPTKDRAESLSIRLDYGSPQGSVEFDLSSREAMLLMGQLQAFQKRYGWTAPATRVLKKGELH